MSHFSNHFNRSVLFRCVLVGGAMLGTPWLGQARADTLMFQDNFGNGVPADSDGVPATDIRFWSVVQNNGGTGGSTSADENNINPGKLTITLADAGTTSGVRPSVTLGSTVSPKFNFSTVKRTFSGTLDLNTNNGTDAGNAVFRLMINKWGMNSYSATDAVTLEILGSGRVTFGWKNGLPNSQPFAIKPVNGAMPDIGKITGFDLSLDSTTYELVVHGTGGAGGTSQTWTDTYANQGGLTHWGDSTLNLIWQENDNGQAARTYTSTVNSIAVTSASPAWSDGTTQTINLASSVQIVADNTEIRSASQSLLLGFNTPWNAIQGDGTGNGLWDAANRQVNPNVVDFLKAYCRNDVYRYPGGTVANTFNWKDSIQPLNYRATQWVEAWNLYVVPDFGFDEFMQMVEQVSGQAVLTINMSLTAQDAADWVEYANAPNDGSNPGGGTDWAAVRAANGHSAPYNISRWELGNELDAPITTGWTSQQYIDAAVPIIDAMRAVDPTIQIVAHAAVTNMSSNWFDWHRAFLNDPNLGPRLSGMALHIYYDNRGISVKDADDYYARTLVNDADPRPIWVTEHAVNLDYDHNLQSDTTTWPRTTSMAGAYASADMLLAFSHHARVELAQWHALGGTGPWRPFNTVDPVTGKYADDFGIRPLTYAFGLLNQYLPGKAVLNTTTDSPNASQYDGDYDVRGVALRDADGQGLYVAAMNRHTADYSAQASLPGLVAGNYVAMRECVGGDDAGVSGIIRHYFNIQVAANGSNGDFPFTLPHGSVVVVRPLETNLLLTPDMETDTNADGIPDNWSKRTPPGTTGSITLPTDGTSFDGATYVRLAKTSGTGNVSLAQSRWDNNSNLKYDGVVGLHAHDYFLATVCVRANALDAAGARIRIQFFEENAQGQIVFAQALDSSVVTGTSDGWITLATPIFRPNDYIHAGYTFSSMEMIPQILSATGSVDYDSVGLLHLPNQVLNADMETDSDSDGIPDNWYAGSPPGTTGSVQQLAGSDAEHGTHYVRLTKTAGTGAVNLAQYNSTGNLGPTGFVASHARESFVATAFIRGNNLDAGGAKLRIQLFQKKPDGTVVFVQNIWSSTTVTGTTGWTQVTIPAFRPCDYVSPGCTFDHLDVVAMTTSATGSADVDDLNLYLQP